jgi:hypothetical protein
LGTPCQGMIGTWYGVSARVKSVSKRPAAVLGGRRRWGAQRGGRRARAGAAAGRAGRGAAVPQSPAVLTATARGKAEREVQHTAARPGRHARAAAAPPSGARASVSACASRAKPSSSASSSTLARANFSARPCVWGKGGGRERAGGQRGTRRRVSAGARFGTPPAALRARDSAGGGNSGADDAGAQACNQRPRTTVRSAQRFRSPAVRDAPPWAAARWGSSPR